MNRAYKLVWNTVSNSWVVASELAKGAKKSSGKTLKLAVFMAAGFSASVASAAPAANALPTGESVANGSATFDRTVTNQLTVNQSSSKLITNWNSFDVGSSGKVVFAQPDAASIALNRVTSGSASEIFGQVTANGQLVIVNPNGITFGAGSQVSAASIIGSVLDIQDSDLNAGNLLFSRGTATGSIDNKGSLSAKAGSVSLLAPSVKNSGTITATGGNTSLINADAADLSAANPVISTASSIGGLVQNSGNITATQVSSVGGKIVLMGDTSQAGSVAALTGTLTADIDSTVSASQIKVAGVLDVNGSNNTLNLSSTSRYNLTFGSKINLNGASSGFSVNGTAYTVIRDVTQLQGMSADLAGKYVLAKDVDASATSTWNSGAGFAPVGTDTNRFSGVLDGLGHAVNDLTINRPGTDFVGLIGSTENSLIQNIGVGGSVYGGGWVGSLVANNNNSSVNNSYATASVTGTYFVGGLIGQTSGSTISNSYATGGVTGGTYWIGGLVGNNYNSLVNNSYATGNVSGTAYVGGLVGNNASIVSNSYATGSVTGNYNIGGLIGANDTNNFLNNVIVNNSYATGSVNGTQAVGGLVGYDNGGLVTNSYWDVDTTGQADAVGGTDGSSTLSNLIAVSGNAGAEPSAYAQGSYANFDFDNTWFMAEGASRPMLRAFLNTPDVDGKIAISNLYQLQGLAANVAGNYFLTQDIDAGATAASVLAGNAGNRSDVWGGSGFAPIGNDGILFTGTLDGLGHVVNGLSISRAATDYVGLIGNAQGSTLQNIGLSNASVRGQYRVGALIGRNTGGSVYNSYVTGSVNGGYMVGGLVGDNYGNAIVSNSYAANSVNGGGAVGGLVGNNYYNSVIGSSYASGSVTGDNNVGGLAGYNEGNTIISNSYASGSVSGNSNVGGLIGTSIQATAVNNYWDTTGTGQASAVGAAYGNNTLINLVGLTSSQMTNLSSFANWGGDIDAQGGTGTIWRIYEGQSGPLLRTFLKPLTVTGGGSKTYDGTSFSGGSYTLSAPADFSKILGIESYSGTALGARNAGTYTLGVSGLYSSQQGYDLNFAEGTFSIEKANIALSTSDIAKTYDGTTAGAGTAIVTGGELFDTDSISGGTFTFNNKNAGSNKTVTVSAVSIDDGNGGNNYNVTYDINSGSYIDPALLSISSSSVIKTYDGTTSAKGTAIVTDGVLFGTDSMSGGTFAFTDKNAGSGDKIVAVSGVSINDGNNGDNYLLSYENNTDSTINKALLSISAVADSKVYDGKLTSIAKPVVIGRQRGDAIVGLTQSFADKNAGTGKIILVNSGYTIRDGNNGNNYDVVLVNSNAGVITPKALNISTVANSKVYDGGLTSANKPLVTGLVTGDRVTGLFQQYETKTVGENKQLLIKNGYVVQDGNGGGNYSVVQQTSTEGVITAH